MDYDSTQVLEDQTQVLHCDDDFEDDSPARKQVS